MNQLKTKIENILIDLKNNHNVIGLKAEFGSEGTTFEEAQKLKDLASKVGLDITIKIGGCEAVTDLCEAKKLCVNNIVAPMIETSYALKKYIKSIQTVFSENEYHKYNFLINIETKTGFDNLMDIISARSFELISGIVVGRNDLVSSLDNINTISINDSLVCDMTNTVAEKMKILNKKTIVGGGISVESIKFFRQLCYLTNIETRKIIFDMSKEDTNLTAGIQKALEFEILWLENKEHFGGILYKSNLDRIIKLKKQLEITSVTRNS